MMILAPVVTSGAGIAVFGGLADDIDNTVSGIGGGSQDKQPDDAIQQGFNRTEVERHFIRLLSEERQDRGLNPVTHREILSDMGENHSRVMAEMGEIGHVEPDGDTIKDRYQQQGLLPECRLPIANSDRYYPGAENAASTWVRRDIELGNGSIVYINSESELAQRLFEQWMGSTPHREAMLVSSADEVGLGLHITTNNKVYASLELC